MNTITVALPKGKLFEPAVDRLAKVGWSADNLSEHSRKLVIPNSVGNINFIITKSADVPTFVEYGAADIGIIGLDVLAESGKNVLQLLDLKFGFCHLMFAVHRDNLRPKLEDYSFSTVATKFPRLAKKFFLDNSLHMQIVTLHGSIELAPISGLSDAIVDIVETGTTLRENNLVEVTNILNSSARLIANRVSYKLNFERINKLVQDLKSVV